MDVNSDNGLCIFEWIVDMFVDSGFGRALVGYCS